MDNNNLENLKKRLYTKGESFGERKGEVKITGERVTLPPLYWKGPKIAKKKNFFLIFIVVLAIALIGLALYFIFSGSNTVSSKNINIEVRGPAYADGGKLNSFNIFIENKNKVGLELADLILEFPDGSFSSDGSALTRVRYSLGKINSGETINKPVEMSFFGLENEEKKIKITLEYRLTESNAIFAKDYDYIVKLSTPAVGLLLSLPLETNSRQELDIKIEAISNAEINAKNLSLQVNYPSGFQFLSAEPRPSLSNNVWSLGDMAPFQKKEIIIKGLIEGQDLENKTFSANIGAFEESGVLNSYGVASETLVVKKSSINFSLFIKGYDLEKNIGQPGDFISGELQWMNNLPVNIRDANIELKLSGAALDEQSNKQVIWNSSSLPVLSSIAPGGTGNVRFDFSVKNPLPDISPVNKNFSIILEAKISGLATTEQGENTEITNGVRKEIEIASSLELTASAIYYSGPFKNSGPLPPKVGQETTYTVLWSLGGNSNDFSKVKVSAPLPSYVRWINNISPVDADIKFDERNGTVTWNAGDLPAGSTKDIAFQIGLTPNASQKGSSPDLIGKAKIEAYDNFIADYFNDTISSLDIMLQTEPKFDYKQGKVVQ